MLSFVMARGRKERGLERPHLDDFPQLHNVWVLCSLQNGHLRFEALLQLLVELLSPDLLHCCRLSADAVHSFPHNGEGPRANPVAQGPVTNVLAPVGRLLLRHCHTRRKGNSAWWQQVVNTSLN